MNKTISTLALSAVLSTALVVACAKKSGDPKPVTHNIVDPADLRSMSKFNSCCHVAVSQDPSIKTSQKHYLKPIVAYEGSKDKIKVFAPCNGKIVQVKDQLVGCSTGEVRGADVYVQCTANESVQVVLYHVDLLSGFANNSSVTAGQQVAYANLFCPGNTESDFDLTVLNNQVHSPLLEYMTDAALAPWLAKGVTVESSKLPQVNCTDAQFADDSVCESQKITF